MSTSAVTTSLRRLIVADTDWFFTLYRTPARRWRVPPIAQLTRAVVAKGSVADLGSAAAEADRCAGSKLRRYCAANSLNRLGTLTYAGSGCHDRRNSAPV